MLEPLPVHQRIAGALMMALRDSESVSGRNRLGGVGRCGQLVLCSGAEVPKPKGSEKASQPTVDQSQDWRVGDHQHGSLHSRKPIRRRSLHVYTVQLGLQISYVCRLDIKAMTAHRYAPAQRELALVGASPGGHVPVPLSSSLHESLNTRSLKYRSTR